MSLIGDIRVSPSRLERGYSRRCSQRLVQHVPLFDAFDVTGATRERSSSDAESSGGSTAAWKRSMAVVIRPSHRMPVNVAGAGPMASQAQKQPTVDGAVASESR
jgi:hypothetical protein